MTLRFDVETDRPLVARDTQTRYVLASIVAPEGTPRERPPVNLGLVLDHSGSMTGEKIRLSKDAAVAAIRRLDPRDRFAVVAYDDRVTVVVPSTTASSESVRDAVRAVLKIEARGSTDLCGGWLRGCEQVGLVQAPDAVTRVLLLTDGLANVGVVDHSEIVRHAAELRRRGIATTTLGVGDDFDEHLLGGMADDGGGHFYYIERDEQIPGAIETEVGEALEVTLRGARLRVGPASALTAAPIAPYPTQREGDEWVIELGDLVSGQELVLPIRISFARHPLEGAEGSSVCASCVLTGGTTAGTEAAVVWTLASGAEVGAQPRRPKVDRAVAAAYAALARREAGRLNREGDFEGAQRRLARTAARIKGYAGSDAVLGALLRDLERDAEVHVQPMLSRDRKAQYMQSAAALMHRMPSGSSKRRAT